ncbi:MAG: glutamate--tRNA ligase [Candidatus Dojkabacteria bacterium]
MRTVEENKLIADLLFSNVKESVGDILKKYPKRKLNEDQLVLRFPPSPTGFVHIGSIYAALINEKLVRQTNGIFIFRAEDTDKEREIANGIEVLVEGIKGFDIKIDEGALSFDKEIGEYGPYIQSKRVEIYKVFAKDLVSKGLAYPCFSTIEELSAIRELQTEKGLRTGYYGEWAKWRDASVEEIKEQLEDGKPFVIRLHSKGNIKNKINIKDLIKGGITLSENDMDSVLLKSDGLPTYHFAHPIDDTLMDISFVLRGDEWLPSQPLHMEIFSALGFDQLQYGHISPLMKLENGGKRKLSKRKDPEADVAYYVKEGYPIGAVKEYLLNIANSNFYDWRIQNPNEDIDKFELKLEKFNKAGALFDISKLNDVCKEYISKLSGEEVYEMTLSWAKRYNREIGEMLVNHRDYAINIFNIEREGSKIRKDIAKYSDTVSLLEIFFDDMYENMPKDTLEMEKGLQREILEDFLDVFYPGDAVDEWFGKIKNIATKRGFSTDYKEYEKDPKKFNGKVGDIAMVLRVAITGKRQTPDLYQTIQVMGESRVRERVKGYINSL